MGDRHCLIDGKLHRLETVRLSWWKKLLGYESARWVPVTPDFT